MAQNVYEGMFILDAGRYARDAAGVSGTVEKLIREAHGELLVSRLWEERRLAYPIKGNRKGAYWLTYFRMDGQHLRGLTRQCEINDAIVRQLFLKVDPRIVDALIAHAGASADESQQKPRGAPAGSGTAKPAADKPQPAEAPKTQEAGTEG